MTQSTLDDYSSTGVECPQCDREFADHASYAVHFGKKQDNDHTGNPVIARFGRERMVEIYWNYGHSEASELLGIGTSTVHTAFDALDQPRKCLRNKTVWEHGVSLDRILYHLHHDALMSVNEMSDVLGVSRAALARWFDSTGVHKRNASEAERVKWENYTEEERKERMAQMSAEVKEAQKSAPPEELEEWWSENPEKRSEFAAKGADGRGENGMAGVTGQDNPNWRGGKNVLDAVKKQLPENWQNRRDAAKERDDHECQNCGTSDCKLDSHHIVPVMCGGTHGFWNLMTLCESCHHKAEWFTRQYPEFEPVLVE